MPKYTTLTQLSAAFRSGELDSTYRVMLDKGGSIIRLRQDGPEEGENERYERCNKLFWRDYANPIDELMKLAGIPVEWC